MSLRERRLDAVGHAVLVCTPVAMVPANRSAALVVTCSVLLIAAARARLLRSVDWRPPLSPSWRLGGAVAFVAVAFAMVSIAWSVDPALSARAVFGAGIPLVASGVLVACWRVRPAPPWLASALAGGLVVGALLIVMELRLGYPIRRHFSDRLVSFVQNRPALTLVVLLWPLCALLTGARSALARLGVGAAVLGAAMISTSGAAKFGLAIGLATAAASWLAPRWSLRACTALLLLLVCVQPYFGRLAESVLPPRLVEASEAAHPRERIEIWQSYGDVARLRLLTGTGFGSAPAAGRDAVAREVPADHRLMLDVGHPHDALLQVWVELGVLGAAALCGAILAAGAVLAATGGGVRHAGLAALMAASAIALVDHEAWQGWWWAVVGLAAALLALAGMRRAPVANGGRSA